MHLICTAFRQNSLQSAHWTIVGHPVLKLLPKCCSRLSILVARGHPRRANAFNGQKLPHKKRMPPARDTSKGANCNPSPSPVCVGCSQPWQPSIAICCQFCKIWTHEPCASQNPPANAAFASLSFSISQIAALVAVLPHHYFSGSQIAAMVPLFPHPCGSERYFLCMVIVWTACFSGLCTFVVKLSFYDGVDKICPQQLVSHEAQTTRTTPPRALLYAALGWVG